MNFPQRNSYNEKNRKRKLTIISVVVIFLILIFSTAFGRSILFYLGSPIWKARNDTVSFFSGKSELLKSKLSLIEENNKLKKEISDGSREKALNDIIRKENDDLKSLFGRDNPKKEILAAVLEKPFLSPYDTLVIDIGDSHGIAVGDKVKSADTYIGYISDVYDNTSKVILYSSYGQKVKVLIGKNNIEKEALGYGGGNFRVEVPRETDIKEGDPIVIPSISPNIFAVVEKIEFKENDALENVLFKNNVNASEINWVLVSQR